MALVSPRILVVDDSAVVRTRLVRELTAAGFTVSEAASCTDGKACDATGLACALLDLDLGDGTGVDVASALRAGAPDLPLAFFSSEPDGALWSAAERFGRCFKKPDELEAALAWARHFLVSP